MDINQVITLGIGTPSDIPHFLLVGLSVNADFVRPTSDVTVIVRARARTIVVQPESTGTVRRKPSRVVIP